MTDSPMATNSEVSTIADAHGHVHVPRMKALIPDVEIEAWSNIHDGSTTWSSFDNPDNVLTSDGVPLTTNAHHEPSQLDDAPPSEMRKSTLLNDFLEVSGDFAECRPRPPEFDSQGVNFKEVFFDGSFQMVSEPNWGVNINHYQPVDTCSYPRRNRQSDGIRSPIAPQVYISNQSYGKKYGHGYGHIYGHGYGHGFGYIHGVQRSPCPQNRDYSTCSLSPVVGRDSDERASKLPRLSHVEAVPLVMHTSSSGKSWEKKPISYVTSCSFFSRPPDMCSRLAEIVGPVEVINDSSKSETSSVFPSLVSSFSHPSPETTMQNSEDFLWENSSLPSNDYYLKVNGSDSMTLRAVALKEELKTTLLKLAEAYATDEKEFVKVMEFNLRRFYNPRGTPIERLIAPFMDALHARYYGETSSKKPAIRMFNDPTISQSIEQLVSNLPILLLSWQSSSVSIIRSLRGDTLVHVLEFGIWRTTSWEPLIRHLGTLSSESRLRITAVEVPPEENFPVRRPCDLSETVIVKKLSALGEKYGVSVEFVRLVSRLEDLRIEMLQLRNEETLVISSTLELNQLPDASVVRSNPRDTVLKFFKNLEPRILNIIEFDANFNMPFFLVRFRECLTSYLNLFEALNMSANMPTLIRDFFETQILPSDILNTIACEGLKRVVRTENLDKWQSRMKRLGFVNISMSTEDFNFIEAMAQRGDCGVTQSNGDLLLSWHGFTFLSCSNWQNVTDPTLSKSTFSDTFDTMRPI